MKPSPVGGDHEGRGLEVFSGAFLRGFGTNWT